MHHLFSINASSVLTNTDTASDITSFPANDLDKYWQSICRAERNASGYRISLLGELSCAFSFRDSHCTGICFVASFVKSRQDRTVAFVGCSWVFLNPTV